MNSTTIAIDVAKSVFELAVSEQPVRCANASGGRAGGSGSS
jgi:hypothetical protein